MRIAAERSKIAEVSHFVWNFLQIVMIDLQYFETGYFEDTPGQTFKVCVREDEHSQLELTEHAALVEGQAGVDDVERSQRRDVHTRENLVEVMKTFVL